MSKIYVPAPGRTIPGGWPEEGRPINPLSAMQSRLVKDGDLVERIPAKKVKTDDI